jgi:hypothetical protein
MAREHQSTSWHSTAVSDTESSFRRRRSLGRLSALTVTASPTTQTLPSQERGSYWITTFGCQMNKADSERMAGILESMGYQEASAEQAIPLGLATGGTVTQPIAKGDLLTALNFRPDPGLFVFKLRQMQDAQLAMEE